LGADRMENAASCGLAGGVVRFADFLKGRGFRVFQSSVHDALLGILQIDVSKRTDFKACLRASFVNTDLEWEQFGDLFETFWAGVDEEPDASDKAEEQPKRRVDEPAPDKERLETSPTDAGACQIDPEAKENLEGVSYSPFAGLEKKDLAQFDHADIKVAQLALKRMMEPFRIQRSRRRRRSPRNGNMDFSRVLRKSLKTGGLPLTLLYKEKKKRLKRLIILADVSGSMDRYAQFVMPFILGLRGVASRAEVFVFSTTLVHITTIIRHLSIEKALKRISEEVPDWSGGTRIGFSLRQFNSGPGKRLLNKRSVVLILSDGWDLGAKELLRREMEALSRKAHRIVWLNPLAGDPSFEPLCQGMRIALPYTDFLLPADSLQSLKRVGRLLSRLMIH